MFPTSDVMKSLFFSNSEPKSAILMQEYVAAEIIYDQEMELIDTDYLESSNIDIIEMYFSLPQMLKSDKLSAINDFLMILCYQFHL